MGGSGNGGPFVNRTAEQLRNIVRNSEDKTTVAAFESELSRTLGDLLSALNSRDTQTVNSRLTEIKLALNDSIEGALDQLFGGSVAKHTYVDGLSVRPETL